MSYKILWLITILTISMFLGCIGEEKKQTIQETLDIQCEAMINADAKTYVETLDKTSSKRNIREKIIEDDFTEIKYTECKQTIIEIIKEKEGKKVVKIGSKVTIITDGETKTHEGIPQIKMFREVNGKWLESTHAY